MNQQHFEVNYSKSAKENFDRFVVIFTKNHSNHTVTWLRRFAAISKSHWTKLTEEEQWEFLNIIRGKEIKDPLRNHGGQCFEKATDVHLRHAARFIDGKSISKFATRYLSLTSQQISGRDVFNVLKLWRDASPYQGSKKVCITLSLNRNIDLLTFFYWVWNYIHVVFVRPVTVW